MMAVAGVKEATMAGRAAIRVLKQHMAQEPIFDADSSRTIVARALVKMRIQFQKLR
jgi:hypothetical protein